jgi:transposase
MSVEPNDEGAPDGGGLRRRRRTWSEAEKRRIVAESYEPGVSVSLVARRHDVNANQVFTWRRQLRRQAPGVPAGGFVPMVVTGDPDCDASAMAGEPAAGETEARTACLPPATGRIEIVLGGGRRVIVDRAVDMAMLARIIAVLEGRPVRRSPEGEGG